MSCQLTGAEPTDSDMFAARAYLADLFYAGEVPRDVMDEDSAVQSRVPVPAAAEVTSPGMVAKYARRMDVPVFLAFGAALDVSPDPDVEPANYTASPDETPHLVPSSRHCCNFASHRRPLWHRIAQWVPTIVPVGAPR